MKLSFAFLVTKIQEHCPGAWDQVNEAYGKRDTKITKTSPWTAFYYTLFADSTSNRSIISGALTTTWVLSNAIGWAALGNTICHLATNFSDNSCLKAAASETSPFPPYHFARSQHKYAYMPIHSHFIPNVWISINIGFCHIGTVTVNVIAGVKFCLEGVAQDILKRELARSTCQGAENSPLCWLQPLAFHEHKKLLACR